MVISGAMYLKLVFRNGASFERLIFVIFFKIICNYFSTIVFVVVFGF
jgi:hypothetical protein